MSYITTVSKYVQLSDNNIGLVIINNVKRHPNNSGHPIIFKVKANMKELIDVRPAYGILINSSERQSATLNIKYLGKIEDIQKAKLQIIWSSIQSQDEKILHNKKLSYNEFSELSKAIKKIQEGSIVLPFNFKSNIKQQSKEESKADISQARSQSGTDSINKGHTSIDTETERQQLINNGKSTQQKQSKVVSKAEVKTDGFFVPIKKVVILALIFFLLGILFGLKIGKMLQKSTENCSIIEDEQKIQEVLTNESSTQATQVNKLQATKINPSQL